MTPGSDEARSEQLLVDYRGFGLIEVMFAMVILSFSVLGVMGSFQWAEHGVRVAVQGTQALAMAQGRLEAKRAVRWTGMLRDDLDADGISEVMMRDDGVYPDLHGGDGTYTAATERSGIKLLWTIRAEPVGPVMDAGLVAIEVRADYQVAPGRWKQVRLATLRGNPGYVGSE